MAARTSRPVVHDSADAGNLSVGVLAGVGPALIESLARLNLRRVQDLWFHLPLRYEDKTRITPLDALRPGMRAQVIGKVEAVEKGLRYRPQLKVAIGDDSAQTLLLRFFHFRRAQIDQLHIGARLLCYGEVRQGATALEMVHPTYQRLSADDVVTVDERLNPVYPTTDGLGQRRLASIIEKALALLPSEAELELIPSALCRQHGLTSLREALLYVHRPPADARLDQLTTGRHPAQKRLAFEELLAQHLSLKRMRAAVRLRRSPVFASAHRLRQQWLGALPFALTGAQQRVAHEVMQDMSRAQPMLRLVQGDVGSGKTAVACWAALEAVEAGAQVALMAPTELLAEQHLRNFRHWLEPLGVDVEWVAGKQQGAARKRAMQRVADGAPMVIGTHALMQEGVAFANLGLVIVDEQHRFGVQQRLALRDKGLEGDLVPHQLVLTATPIPRTLP